MLRGMGMQTECRCCQQLLVQQLQLRLWWRLCAASCELHHCHVGFQVTMHSMALFWLAVGVLQQVLF